MNNQRYIIFALFFAIFVDALGWGVSFPVLAPLILKNTVHMLNPNTTVAMRNFLYEFALGLYTLAMFITAPILGSLSDKYGRKYILILSMLGLCIGFCVSGFAVMHASLIGVLIGRMVCGATAGSIPISQAAMMDISADDQKAARLGLVVVANVCGFAVGPAIGSVFMDPSLFGYHVLYQLPFFVTGAMGLLGAILISIYFKETFYGNRALKINPLTGFVNIYHALTQRTTALYTVAAFCFLGAWGMFFSSMPVFLDDRFNWHGPEIGAFITYIAMMFAIMTLFVMPRIAKRFSQTGIVLVAIVALLLCDILLPLLHQSFLTWLVVLLAMSVPFIYVGIVTLLSMQVDSDNQGNIMGVVSSLMAICFGLGPIIGGWLMGAALTAPNILIGLFLVIAFWLVRKKHTQA